MVAERLNTRRSGSGEPLVLIHGIGSSLKIWDQMLPALEANHDVIGVDLPGFGESPMPEQGCSPAALAKALADELDAQGVERPHVVGNSLGGWVALELAALGRAADVLAFSPAGMWSEREKRFVDWSLKLNRANAKAIAPLAAPLMSTAAGRCGFIQVVSRPWRVPAEDMAGAVKAMAGARNFGATLRAMLAHQPSALESIDCPVLIAWGTRDYLLFPRQGRRFERFMPGADLRPLEGLGHAPMLDAPDGCAALVLEWTARTGATTETSAAAALSGAASCSPRTAR